MPAQSTAVAEYNEFRDQLESRAHEFTNALPSHIRPEYFQRATLTALNQNPELFSVDRRSLFNALMRCAQDGLIPDGRQAALVIFKDKERGKIAQYMQMVAGIRILVQQSKEITRFEQVVVYANDKFSHRLGDRPFINHEPALDDRGAPIAVYSIAQFRDGTLSRDVMPVEDVEKVRGVSRQPNGPAWRDWWGEMARKTVAKHHAKSLPMSNDTMAALARDDTEHFNLPTLPPAQVVDFSAPPGRPRLAQQLDAISQTHSAENSPRRRGRPRTKDSTEPEGGEPPPGDPPPTDEDRVPDQLDLAADGQEQSGDTKPADGWPGPRPDFEQGQKDAFAGRAGCLNREIRESPARMAEWQKGFDSAGKARP